MIRAVLAAAALAAAGAAAADAPAELVLTADEAARRAAAADPRAAACRVEAAAAGAACAQETLWRDPELRLTYGWNSRVEYDPNLSRAPGVGVPGDGVPGDFVPVGGNVEEEYDEYEAAVRVFIPRPWEARAERRRRRAALSVAEAAGAAAAAPAAARARVLCDELVYRDAALDWCTRRERQFRAAADWTRAHGIMPDLAAASVQVLNAARDRDAAAGRLAETQRELAALIGLRESGRLRVPPPARPAWFLDASDEQILRLAERLPDPAGDEASALAAEARAEASAARAGRWPWFEFIQGGYVNQQRFEEDEGWSVYGAISLPVFSRIWDAGRPMAAAAAARTAEAETARAARAALVARTLADAREAWRRGVEREAEIEALVRPLREALAEKKSPLTEPQRWRFEEALLEAERGGIEACYVRNGAVTALRNALSPLDPGSH